ncbi:MAG: hypothetical protein QM679_12075 [Patulibacter sp.]
MPFPQEARLDMTMLRSLALVAVASGAVGLAGCGGGGAAAGDDASSGTDAKSLLADTFRPSEHGSKIKSATIDLKLDGKLTGKGALEGTGEAKVVIGQAQQGQLPNFSAAVSLDGQQQGGRKIKLNAGGTYVGKRVYVSYDGIDYDLGQELSERATASLKRAFSVTADGKTSKTSKTTIGQLGLHPDTWLTDPRVDGEEQIGGIDAYKITGKVALKALVPDVLAAAKKVEALAGTSSKAKVPTVTDAQLDEVAKQIKQLDVAIWTGKNDRILRQLAVDLTLGDTDSSDALDATLQLTLTGVNEQQKIVAPSDTKPVTELIPKLSALFGRSGGADSSSTTSSSASVPDAYVNCVDQAGGDPAKLNACQDELQ